MDLQREILDAARRLLVATGYERLSMRRIAREIGISATSIYLHFANKDALFEALVDEGMEELHALLADAGRREESPRQALEAICRTYVRFGLDNREYYEIMFILRSDAMKRFPTEKYRRARRNLELLSTLVQQSSGADRETAYQRATAAWAMLHGVVSLIVARRMDAAVPEEVVVNRIIASAVRQCLMNDADEWERHDESVSGIRDFSA